MKSAGKLCLAASHSMWILTSFKLWAYWICATPRSVLFTSPIRIHQYTANIFRWAACCAVSFQYIGISRYCNRNSRRKQEGICQYLLSCQDHPSPSRSFCFRSPCYCHRQVSEAGKDKEKEIGDDKWQEEGRNENSVGLEGKNAKRSNGEQASWPSSGHIRRSNSIRWQLALTDGRDIISTWMSEAGKPNKGQHNKGKEKRLSRCAASTKQTFQSIINENVKEPDFSFNFFTNIVLKGLFIYDVNDFLPTRPRFNEENKSIHHSAVVN